MGYNLKYIQWMFGNQVLPWKGDYVPCKVIIGGDSQWLPHLFGLSVHWLVRSVFTYAIWTKHADWVDVDVERTIQLDKQLYQKYRQGNLANDKKTLADVGRCIHHPLL